MVVLMVRGIVLSSRLGGHTRACQPDSRLMVHKRVKSIRSEYLVCAKCAVGLDFVRGYEIFHLEWLG